MNITMERRFFAVNRDGHNEFEYLLYLLGVPKEKRSDIDEVSFDVDLGSVDWQYNEDHTHAQR